MIQIVSSGIVQADSPAAVLQEVQLNLLIGFNGFNLAVSTLPLPH